ncbi:MAG: hypothetical protein WC789_02700 [Lentisphaeria bacterium]|jgi:hypothetical protein
MLKRLWLMIAAVMVFGATVGAERAAAQAAGIAGFQIRKTDSRRIRPPDIKATDGRARNRADWWLLQVEYDTAGGRTTPGSRSTWQDEITLDLTILAPAPVKGARGILMKRSVTYIDVEDRSEPHVADFYIRPGFLERHLKNVSYRDVQFYVELKAKDRLVARHDSANGRAGQWWIVDERRVAPFNEELLTRDQTPFAPYDYDFYEQIKPGPAGGR